MKHLSLVSASWKTNAWFPSSHSRSGTLYDQRWNLKGKLIAIISLHYRFQKEAEYRSSTVEIPCAQRITTKGIA